MVDERRRGVAASLAATKGGAQHQSAGCLVLYSVERWYCLTWASLSAILNDVDCEIGEDSV